MKSDSETATVKKKTVSSTILYETIFKISRKVYTRKSVGDSKPSLSIIRTAFKYRQLKKTCLR